jgi:hypothetical protein
MHLGVFVLGTGNHMAGWRTDGAFTTHMELPVMHEIARIAEAGKFDLLFISDSMAMDPTDHPSFLCRFEPTTLITALAACTIGRAAAVSHGVGGADGAVSLGVGVSRASHRTLCETLTLRGEACVVAPQSNQARHRVTRSAHGVSRRRRCGAARLTFDAGARLRRDAPIKNFLRETLWALRATLCPT